MPRPPSRPRKHGRRFPHAIFLAGPKGAGKSTAAPALLRDDLGIVEFINADTIAAGLSAFQPESAALHAGAILLQRIDEMVARRRSFAIETTLASKTYAPRITASRPPDIVSTSTFSGCLQWNWRWSAWQPASSPGHDIPESTIRRRYVRGLINFRERYCRLVDRWIVYDGSTESGSDPIAEMEQGSLRVLSAVRWEQFEEGTT